MAAIAYRYRVRSPMAVSPAAKLAYHDPTMLATINWHSSDVERIDLLKGESMDFKHNRYYQAIITDDDETVEAILDSVPENDRDTFLNGKFFYQQLHLDDTFHHPRKHCDILLTHMVLQRPLSLAVAYRSTKVFNLLLDRGADIFLSDTLGNSIIHVVIATCYVYPDSVDTLLEYYCTIFSKLETYSVRKKLLFRENVYKLTPIELAIKLRCYELFKAILYTDGAYRKLVAREGKVIYNEFDLSEYTKEHGRYFTSPIRFLNLIQEDELDELAKHQILQIPVMKIWIRRTILHQFPYIILWLLFRLILPITFILTDAAFVKIMSEGRCEGNGTNSVQAVIEMLKSNIKESSLWHYQIALGVASALSAFGILSIDTIELIARARRPKHLKEMLEPMRAKITPAVTTFSFRVSQFCYAIASIVTVVSGSLPFSEYVFTVMTIAITIQRFMIVYSLLYFAQAIPYIGFFVIGFQKMLRAMARFLLLFFAAVLLYWSIFNGVALNLCSKGPFLDCKFTTGHDFYTNFLVMLNMVQISDHRCTDAGDAMMYTIHISYVFIISILLLNYLIAVMSSVYSNLAVHKQIITTLYQLHFANVTCIRLKILSKLIGRRLGKATDTFVVVTKEFEPTFKTAKECTSHHVKLVGGLR